jgi:aspartate carbamoyltransferase catalytic subunit
MPGRSLIDLDDCSVDELNAILDRAASFKLHSPPRSLEATTVVNLFFEASTRTFASFNMAQQRLGAHIISINPSVSSFVKGETVQDTAITLSAMGVDMAVVRHAESGFVEQFASAFDGSVINAGDGAHAHPTQALLDLLTMREEFGRLDGLSVLIVGDVLHSRVARSNALGLRMLGADVTYCGPRSLVPDELASAGVTVAHDLDRLLPRADVVMLLRVQRERFGPALVPTQDEYAATYRVDERRLGLLQRHAIVMHPGPYNRGIELTDDVTVSDRWRYREQVRNGVFVRMAVLEFLARSVAAPKAAAG